LALANRRHQDEGRLQKCSRPSPNFFKTNAAQGRFSFYIYIAVEPMMSGAFAEKYPTRLFGLVEWDEQIT